MANTALFHQPSEKHEQAQLPPLRIEREGFELLRERLREANVDNPQFELQYKRLVALLQTVFRRLESEFGDQVDLVVADGDWARYGIDLRNLPFDDIVLLIVVHERERPFSLYWDIADRVFADLEDDDVIFQFRLATQDEWESDWDSARRRGTPDALGIHLLARAS